MENRHVEIEQVEQAYVIAMREHGDPRKYFWAKRGGWTTRLSGAARYSDRIARDYVVAHQDELMKAAKG
jgi:hypothetical protein